MTAYQFDFPAVFSSLPTLIQGAVVTVELTAIGGFGGLVLGIVCAWGKTMGPLWLRKLLGGYVEAIRNTPFLIQLSFFYFGLPALGIRLDGMQASLLAIVINMGAYNAEIIRAGIDATPRGQLEAAASMAMSRALMFRHVVLIPALSRVWPALCSQIVLLLLDSAVCSQVATKDLTYAANIIASQNFRSFETYFVVTIIYFLLAVAIRRLLRETERHLIVVGASSK